MKIKYLSFWILIIFWAIGGYSQVRCGSAIDYSNMTKGQITEFIKKEIAIRQDLLKSAGDIKLNSDDTLLIPVVFHIVMPNPFIITKAILANQMDILNKCVQGRIEGQLIDPFEELREGLPIKFVFAEFDPNGEITEGITRTVSNQLFNHRNLSLESLKFSNSGGKSRWFAEEQSEYVNIWIADIKNPLDTNDILFGEATFPNDYDATLRGAQGIIINYRALPINDGFPNFNGGKTLVHEMGHYFGLLHIWGDEEGCSKDDFINDTPLQDKETLGCPYGYKNDHCQPTGNGIMYNNFMDYTMDNCLNMFTIEQASILWAFLTINPDRKFLVSPENKALKSGGCNYVFTHCNTPAFSQSRFQTVALNKNGIVFAGSADHGLYRFDGQNWSSWNQYTQNNFRDIEADRAGGFWAAQSGYGGTQSTTGGLLYFPNANFEQFTYYGAGQGVASRNMRSLFIIPSKNNPANSLPYVWAASVGHTSGPTATAGGLSRGLNTSLPFFTAIRSGFDVSNLSNGPTVVGGDDSEIWSFVPNNGGKSQIVRRNPDDLTILSAYDATNVFSGLLPSFFECSGIYFDINGNKWITVNNHGLFVLPKNGSWTKVEFTGVPSSELIFKPNAIAGDDIGNVYFGSSSGLYHFKAQGSIFINLSYSRYTIESGLPSNNINGIAVDRLRDKVILATDNGICFFNPTCGKSGQTVKMFASVSSGNLDVGANWCKGEAPDENTRIIVKHNLTVDKDTKVKSVRIEPGGELRIAPGVKFDITEQ